MKHITNNLKYELLGTPIGIMDKFLRVINSIFNLPWRSSYEYKIVIYESIS